MADEDRRAIIAEAFEASEAANAPETPEVVAPKPTESEAVGTPPAESVVVQPVETPETPPAAPEPTPAPRPETSELDRPPQSWKPAEKAKWAQLDPDIRHEVLRRERDVTNVLNETAQARQLASTFQQAVQPYMARIKSMGADPVQAVSSLLQADHMLSTANKSQRAQLMAKLISDYDVDIVALDTALAGKPVADPIESTVEQLVSQRMAPFNQYMAQQNYNAQQRQLFEQQQAAQTVEQMANDSRYPHFQRVRQDMADLIDLSAKKNIPLGLEAAYNKAVMLDPTLSNSASPGPSAAASQNQQAQRALKASKSISGAPNTALIGSPTPTDRRAAIAAAFDSLATR